MKKILLILAAIAVFATTTAIPTFADGNPWPLCDANGCHKPLPPQ